MTTTIRLLADVGDDPKGAVISVPDRRAQRLLRTGYAEAVEDQPERQTKRKGKE